MLLIALLATGSSTAFADAPALASGVYDGRMLVGFDPAARVVTGYFSETTVRRQFSCNFYLTGTLRGSEAALSTYSPEAPVDDFIRGRMVLSSRDKFQVRLPTEHGGCWNVEHFADDKEPAEFNLEAAYPWISVAVVKRDRAYFYDTPASATHRKGYVVKGDGVGVRAARPGWLQVDFVKGDRPISGWIKQSDVEPPEPQPPKGP